MKKLDQLIQEKAQRQKNTSRKTSPENVKRVVGRSTSKNVSSPQNTIKLLEQHASWLDAAKKEALSRSQYESLEKSTRERVLSQRKNQPHYAQPTQSMKIREDLNHQPIIADHSFYSRAGGEERLNQTMFAGHLDTSYQNDTSVTNRPTRLSGTPSRPHQRTLSQPKSPAAGRYASVSAAHSRKPSSSPKPVIAGKGTISRPATPPRSPKPLVGLATKTGMPVKPAKDQEPPKAKVLGRGHSPGPSVGAGAAGKEGLPLKSKVGMLPLAKAGVTLSGRVMATKSKTPVRKPAVGFGTGGISGTGRFGVPLVQKLTPVGKGRAETIRQKSPIAVAVGVKSSAVPPKNPATNLLHRTGSPCFDDLPAKLMQQVSTTAPLVSPRDSLDHSGFVQLENLSQNGMFSGKGAGSHDSDDSEQEEDQVVDPVQEISKNKSYRYADWDLAQSAKQSKRVSAVHSTRNSWDKKPKPAQEVQLQIDHLFKKDSGALNPNK